MGLAVLLLLTLLPVAHGSTQAAESASLTVLSQDETRLLVELTIPAPTLSKTVIEGQVYTTVAVDGLTAGSPPGAPALPGLGQMIALPPGATATLHILADEVETMALTAAVAPSPTQSTTLDPETLWPIPDGLRYLPDPAIYGADALYPAAPVTITAADDWRGQQVARLHFNPVQVNPVTNRITVHRRLRVEIRFGGAQLRTVPPADPFFADLRAAALLNGNVAQGWRTQPAPIATTRRGSADQPWIKIAVRDEGLYRLTCAELAAAGISLGNLALDRVQLFHGGRDGVEIALHVIDNGAVNRCDGNDTVRFWATAIDNKYTDLNVYWLTYGGSPGLRMTSRAAGAGGTPVTVTAAEMRMEQNRYYAPHMPRIEDYEHWFWDLLSTTNPNFPATRSYTFTLETGATVTGLTAALAGYTGAHRTQIRLNGTLLGEQNWSGYSLLQPGYAIQPGWLLPGDNVISVTESHPGSSMIVVDNFRLAGTRPLRAVDDRLIINAPGAGDWRFQSSGFASPAVETLDLSDPARPVRITGAGISQPCPCGVSFGDTSTASTRYAVVGTNAVRAPLAISAAIQADLHSVANGADYILIAHADFIPALAPLVALRQQQGMRVRVVDVADIYDEFNGGIADPTAIRSFLAYAYAQWQPPAPAFVVLVGDGHYDPKGYCATPGACLNNSVTPPGSSFIPPYLRLVDPWIGETAADAQLTMHAGKNSLPFMALGRLPVNSLAEAETVVAKLVNYESNPVPGAWRSRLSFVADNAYLGNGTLDPAGHFWRLSDAIVNNPYLVPPSVQADRLYLNVCNPATYPHCALTNPPYVPYTSGSAINAAIVGAINEGRVLVNYVGHAAPSSWGGAPVMLRTTDLGRLSNGGQLPL